jgi:hypothetical protein
MSSNIKFHLNPQVAVELFQVLLGVCIQWVQVKGMLHNGRAAAKLGCGPILAKQGQKNVGTGFVRE